MERIKSKKYYTITVFSCGKIISVRFYDNYSMALKKKENLEEIMKDSITSRIFLDKYKVGTRMDIQHELPEKSFKNKNNKTN